MKNTAWAMMHHTPIHIKYGTWTRIPPDYRDKHGNELGKVAEGHLWCTRLYVMIITAVGKNAMGTTYNDFMENQRFKYFMEQSPLMTWFHLEINMRK